jgi:ubiquinone biosynthesis protein UbiJ
MHTPEPWAYQKPFSMHITGKYGTVTCSPYGCDIDNVEANAARIVACVNACAGTTTDDLVKIAEAGGLDRISLEWRLEVDTHAAAADDFADQVDELTQERDRLKAQIAEMCASDPFVDYLERKRLEKLNAELVAAMKLSADCIVNAQAPSAAAKILFEAIAKAGGNV